MIRRLAPLGFAALLVACASGVEPVAEAPLEPAPATEAPATATTEPTVGETGSSAFVPEALRFSAPLVGGGEIEMDALAGRPVLLWFWAPW